MTHAATTVASQLRHRNGRATMLTVAAAGALTLAACSSDESDSATSEPAADRTVSTTTVVDEATTTLATSTTVVTISADEAATRAEAYLASFAAGDVDAVLSQHTDDFVMRAAFPRDALGELAVTEWLGVVYQTALGTDYTDLECAIGDGEEATVVECAANMITKIHDETNTPGVPTELTVTVATDGIAGLDSRYLANLGVLGFYEWRDLQPEALIDDPSTVAEAADWGRLESEFAAEYTAFGVTAVEETFAAFNAADLGGFLGRFTRGAGILGVRSADIADVYGALMAAGQRYEIGDCAPAGVDGFDLAITCPVTVLPALGGSGIEMAGTVTMDVDIEGVMRRTSDTIDRSPAIEFRAEFEQWLAETHPDVHGSVEWLLDARIPSDPLLIAPYYEEFIAQSDAYPVGS